MDAWRVVLLDIIIVILVAAQVFRWTRLGFLLGFFSFAGMLSGLLVGLMLAPFIIGWIDNPSLQTLISILVLSACAIGLGLAGQYLGIRFRHLGERLRLGIADKIVGGVFGCVATLLFVWLVTSVFSGLPYPSVNYQIRESRIIAGLNSVLPPAPSLLDRLASLINPSDYPRFFFGPEPRPLEPVEPPSSATVAAAMEATRGSIVRIESAGCGGVLLGSGFVVAENLVITNAHVVAGTTQPTIVDIANQTKADVILFDTEQDIAVLRARSELAGDPLPLRKQVLSRGSTGTTLGYPGGGPLAGSAAAVLAQMEAYGRDIYGNGRVVRDVYQLQTEVVQGNSGGPVVREDGSVIAIIFGRSEAQAGIGYALTARAVGKIVDGLNPDIRPVSTMQCIKR